MEPGTLQRRFSADGRAVAAAAALFVALALFGGRYHWVEEAGTAERDGYVSQAEMLLRGELPRDPYRPLLYPLLTAALAAIVREPFLAARLLTNLAAVILTWQAYLLGKRLAGPAAGGWAMALTAVNPNLWILGQHVTTDMPFAALAGLTLVCGLGYLRRPGPTPAMGAGAAYGLAAFTRSNAPFLLPLLAGAWWLAPGSRRRRAGHLAAAALLAALVLLPHWALRSSAFGDALHDENWKNLAWKLYGYPDWSYLERVPFSGPGELLRESSGAVLTEGFRELARFLRGGFVQLLGTWLHVLLFAAGAWVALQRRRLEATYLLASMAVMVGATALTFFTWGRLLLVLLPLAAALTACVWADETSHERFPRRFLEPLGKRRASWITTVVALGTVALLGVKTFAFRIPAFIDRHPYVEVATLRSLQHELPDEAVLGGTSPFLGRYLRLEYLDLPDAFGEEAEVPSLYFDKLARLLRLSTPRYLVVGAKDLRNRPHSLLDPPAPVRWLEPVASDRGVTVWRVLSEKLPVPEAGNSVSLGAAPVDLAPTAGLGGTD